MRYKITFQRQDEQNSSIDLHHQHLLAEWLRPMLDSANPALCYSTFKGTSKVHQGQIKFISSKITWILASSDEAMLSALIDKIMALEVAEIGTLKLTPKQSDALPYPEFIDRTKYVCISPMVPVLPEGKKTNGEHALDPQQGEFSDQLFDVVMQKMEAAGFTEEQLDKYRVFGITADQEYLHRQRSAGKRIYRNYTDKNHQEFLGYLFPFSMHAHLDVHKFIWDNGLGLLTEQGFGMIDTADKSSHAAS